MTAPTSPLRAVLDQFQAGARSVAEITSRTGLREDLVRAIVDHLVRVGRLRAETLSAGCPARGCHACPSSVADACAVRLTTARATPAPGGGVVALSLRR